MRSQDVRNVRRSSRPSVSVRRPRISRAIVQRVNQLEQQVVNNRRRRVLRRPRRPNSFRFNRTNPLNVNRYSKIGSWSTGKAPFQVRLNSLVGRQNVGQQNVVRIRRKEFVSDVSSSIAFVNTTYNINPGLSTLFPWLSAVAANFDEYCFHGLIFEFNSTSSNALNSTNTALGTMILATAYDVLDPAFSSKSEMENYQYAVSSKPSSCIVHPVECRPRANVLSTLYIRTDDAPTDTDLRFYDLGLFQLASVGSQAVATVGELWVSYDISLSKPKLSTTTVSSIYTGIYTPVVATAAGYFGTIGSPSTANTVYSNIDILVYGSSLTFPTTIDSGNYLIFASWIGTSTALTNGISYSLTGCDQLLIFNSQIASANNLPSGVTTTIQFICLAVTLNSASAVVAISGGTLPGSGFPELSTLIVTSLSSEVTLDDMGKFANTLLRKTKRKAVLSSPPLLILNEDGDSEEFKSIN
jgi:hypothetical protein